MITTVGRREFTMLLGGAAVLWPLAARAQQPEPMRRIGVLMSTTETDPEEKSIVAAFVSTLASAGWTPGRNVTIDYRWGAGDPHLTREYARELVALAPDRDSCKRGERPVVGSGDFHRADCVRGAVRCGRPKICHEFRASGRRH
jgi:hypothetical protein